MAARTVGPAFGYILGSAALTMYADPKHIPGGLTDSSPSWIGAWWIGFIVIGKNFWPPCTVIHLGYFSFSLDLVSITDLYR